MQSALRYGLAVLVGLSIIAGSTPIGSASESRTAGIRLVPAEGMPGTAYRVGATNIPRDCDFHLLFDGVDQSVSVQRRLEQTDGGQAAILLSRVPAKVRPGTREVSVTCGPESKPTDTVGSGTFEVLEAEAAVATVDVPGLTGRSVAEARAQLESAGLRLGEVTGDSGKVVSQSPGRGAPVRIGSAVAVTIGVRRTAGPPSTPAPQAKLVVVPTLKGMTVAAAQAKLKRSGLRLANRPKGQARIQRQNPPAGSRVALGGAVSISFRPAATAKSEEPVIRNAGSPWTGQLLLGVLAVLLVLGLRIMFGRSRSSRRTRRRRRTGPKHARSRPHVRIKPQPDRAGLSELKEVRSEPAGGTWLLPRPDPGIHSVGDLGTPVIREVGTPAVREVPTHTVKEVHRDDVVRRSVGDQGAGPVVRRSRRRGSYGGGDA